MAMCGTTDPAPAAHVGIEGGDDATKRSDDLRPRDARKQSQKCSDDLLRFIVRRCLRTAASTSSAAENNVDRAVAIGKQRCAPRARPELWGTHAYVAVANRCDRDNRPVERHC
eukprot:804505-Prymnesium_polylepis.1